MQSLIKIDGMHCQACVNNVSKLLSALPGVSAVQVQLSPGEARVEHPAGAPTAETLVATIEDAGFDAELRESN